MIQMSGRAADRPSVTFRASFCWTQYHTGSPIQAPTEAWHVLWSNFISTKLPWQLSIFHRQTITNKHGF